MNTNKHKPCNIKIFAFIEDYNIGDPVIGETAQYLVNKICSENNINANIELCSLFPPNSLKKFYIAKFLRKQCRKNNSNWKRFLIYLFFRIYILLNKNFTKYYEEKLKGTDIVIFGGGGMLKYISQEFWAADYCIINYCEKHNIPVFFNAIGIEGYDNKNFTSNIIQKILNKKCIAGITTRDDIEALNKFLPNLEHKVVGDPALYSNELYINNTKQQDIIGINTIRSGIFSLNGFDATEEDVINFYYEIIKRLEKDNFKWQIFTNGIPSDYNIGISVLKKLGYEPNDNLIEPLPKSSQELINTILKYKAIIAGRMHAHIIATSYDIPTIGQIWNEKIKWFAKHLGCEERFFYPNEMKNYDHVYQTLKNAIIEGNSNLNTKILKQKTYEELKHFIKSYS